MITTNASIRLYHVRLFLLAFGYVVAGPLARANQEESSGPVEAANPPSANFSVEALRDSVLTMHGKLKSLLVIIESSHSKTFDIDTVRSLAVAKGPMRYFDLLHVEYASLESDPLSFVQILNDGFHVYYPYARMYEQSQTEAIHPQYTIKIHAAPPFEFLAWWPPEDPSVPPHFLQRAFFLIETLRDLRWRVRPYQQQINTQWCHVLEIPAVEALWIEGSTGVVVRRELMFEEKNSVNRVIYEYGDFQDFGNGIILPRRIVRRRPPPFEPVTYHRVLRYAVNNVDNRSFSVALPPGSIVLNRDSDTFRQNLGGSEFLDIIIQRCHSCVDLMASKHRSLGGYCVLLLSFLMGASISVLLWLIVTRRWPKWG